MKYSNYKKVLSIIAALTLTSTSLVSSFPVMALEEDAVESDAAIMETDSPQPESGDMSGNDVSDMSEDKTEDVSEDEVSDVSENEEPNVSEKEEPDISEDEVPDVSGDEDNENIADSNLDNSTDPVLSDDTLEDLEDLFSSGDAEDVFSAGTSENIYELGTKITSDTDVSYSYTPDKSGFYKIYKDYDSYLNISDNAKNTFEFGEAKTCFYFFRQGITYHLEFMPDNWDNQKGHFSINLYKDLSGTPQIIEAGFFSKKYDSSLHADFTWTLDNTYTLTISGVAFPEDDKWYYDEGIIEQYKNSIKTVTLGEGIKQLNSFFSDLPALENLNLPASLFSIYAYDFGNYPKLKNISIPSNSSLTNIPSNSFKNTRWYKSQTGNYISLSNTAIKYRGKETTTTIPGNIQILGSHSMENNSTLKKVTIPGNVTTIAYAALAGDSALEKVILKNGVKTIGGSAFLTCKKMKEITIPKSVTKISSYAIGYYNPGPFKGTRKLPSNQMPTIKCYSNSAAHKYAKKKGIPYKLLDASSSTKKITVKFNGSGAKPSKASITAVCGKSYGTLPSVKRTGYTFQGWYTASKGGSKITKNSKVTITKNHTLYARWKAKTYQIIFNSNGGKKISASKNVTYNSSYGELPVPKKTDYKFNGWYTSKTNGTKITKKDKVKITKNITLYAHWKKIKGNIYGCVIGSCTDDKYTTENETNDIYHILTHNKLSAYNLKESNIKKYVNKTTAMKTFQINNLIKNTFNNTTEKDISFVYYLGHGVYDEAVYNETQKYKGQGILTSDSKSNIYNYDTFINMLEENIKGKIVLIVNACFSEGFVESAKKSSGSDRIMVFSSSKIDEISTGSTKIEYKNKQGDLIGYIIETILGGIHDNKSYMFFTYILTTGLNNNKMDQNHDGYVSGEELGKYMSKNYKLAEDKFFAPYYIGFKEKIFRAN